MSPLQLFGDPVDYDANVLNVRYVVGKPDEDSNSHYTECDKECDESVCEECDDVLRTAPNPRTDDGLGQLRTDAGEARRFRKRNKLEKSGKRHWIRADGI